MFLFKTAIENYVVFIKGIIRWKLYVPTIIFNRVNKENKEKRKKNDLLDAQRKRSLNVPQFDWNEISSRKVPERPRPYAQRLKDQVDSAPTWLKKKK